MYRLKRFSSVGACTPIFVVVLLTFVEGACNGKGPINSNKEGGLASASEASPMSNLNASANPSSNIIPARDHVSVTIKGKEVSVDTSFSEIIGSGRDSTSEWIRSLDRESLGWLHCSGRFIFGDKELEAGRYLMFLRRDSRGAWRLLLFRPRTESENDPAIATMRLDEKPRNEDQGESNLELEAVANYVVITIRLADIELKGKFIVV